MAWRGRAMELGETAVPAALAMLALALDATSEDGPAAGGGVHVAAAVLRVLAVVLCAVGALRGLGRYGRSRLAQRFAGWRGGGLLAGAASLGLGLADRLPSPAQVNEALLPLDAVAIAWILLTGWVWGRGAWERLAPPSGEATAPERAPAHAWGARSIEEA